jgi:hypothetical protein
MSNVVSHHREHSVYIDKVGRFVRAAVAIVCSAISPVSFADCQSAKRATAADIAGGQADVLLKAMVAACKAEDPAKFFSLQTEDANKVLAPSSPADKKKLFAQYCTFTTEAVNGLGGNVSTAVHSVGPYKNRAKCGVPASYWFVHNKGGELALRLEVAVESGRLKIDTH